MQADIGRLSAAFNNYLCIIYILIVISIYRKRMEKVGTTLYLYMWCWDDLRMGRLPRFLSHPQVAMLLLPRGLLWTYGDNWWMRRLKDECQKTTMFPMFPLERCEAHGVMYPSISKEELQQRWGICLWLSLLLWKLHFVWCLLLWADHEKTDRKTHIYPRTQPPLMSSFNRRQTFGNVKWTEVRDLASNSGNTFR